ncbi:MFS family permease [Cupriavidus metallidurans]|jgi:MFS family permease|uniref:Permease of the major facilitator superfamily n=2 Tax=Cupriavidus metallidurans TaxID=119219 RepID=Q1LBL0_CUPMC|nr:MULTISPECIES: MFS transporter [Cupriavidus]ABF12466.1 Permease of the major facilitator superfamily [Cupriavidus metallidurans CH34]AVA35179.1 MFS transporter [Cupriavidus metallidurans]KWR80714.1 arabinose ABC transporter permease [Cupriavidus sp. SHE]KWW34339.1 Inner membrane metabolite transport protein YhjE [Cupriavidus metallidurans]MDE4921220.1 MFS transporter [Cupriavidus metallidurans]
MASLSHQHRASPTAPPAPGHHDVAPAEIATGVVIGRASEYFDFFTYGIASVLVFPSVYFPFASELAGLLYSFAIFSFAFVGRPFGTTLFMRIQRRWGRGIKLTASLFLLGTATVGIAFLPSYASIGSSAIYLLALFRFLQGIAFGGSWDGLPSLLALNAPENKRGWYAMVGQLGAPTGFIVAGALFLFLRSSLTPEEFIDWGWRYPFYVAFAINVVALFARLRLVVTHEYTRLLEEDELEPISTLQMVNAQGFNIFLGAFAALASYALFHLVTVFPLSWVSLHKTQNITDVLAVQIVGAVIAFIGTLISGWLADRIGRRTTLATMAVLIGIFSLFSPWLLDGGATGQNLFILIGFGLLGLSYGQAAGVVTSNFETRYRYTGAALTTDFAWLFGAAFAPLVALGLSSLFGLVAVSLYLLSGVVGTLVALRINRALGTPDD